MRAGNLLIWLGIGATVVGVMVKLGWFSWFGNLPGDIRSESQRGGFFFPITSSLLVSVVASIVINLVLRIFRDR
jgi:di/tricarboxylate transporter